MPKSKKQRYEEAVDRNIKSAKGPHSARYQGRSFAQAKQALGIRKDDESYDDQVTTLVKTPEKKKKKED